MTAVAILAPFLFGFCQANIFHIGYSYHRYMHTYMKALGVTAIEHLRILVSPHSGKSLIKVMYMESSDLQSSVFLNSL